MAGMPPIRCFNCNYDHGRFRSSLEKLRSHIRMNPAKKHLWYIAFEQFRICEMCRAQFNTVFNEFDSHLSLPSANLPEKYADILHKADMNPKGGLIAIAMEYKQFQSPVVVPNNDKK